MNDLHATPSFKALDEGRLQPVDKGGVVEADVDGGFDGASVEAAETLWACLPQVRKWTSLATHEKALVIHTLARHRNQSETGAALTSVNEKAVMVCPQCEGEGGYPDGLDEAACHTDCTRCDGNGWIVDIAALAQPVEAGEDGTVE